MFTRITAAIVLAALVVLSFDDVAEAGHHRHTGTDPRVVVKVQHEAHRVLSRTQKLDPDTWLGYRLNGCDERRGNGWVCKADVAYPDGAVCVARLTIRRERILDTHGKLVRIGKRYTTQRFAYMPSDNCRR